MIPKCIRGPLALFIFTSSIVAVLALLVLLADDGWSVTKALQTNGAWTISILTGIPWSTLAWGVWVLATSRFWRTVHWFGGPVMNHDLIREREAAGLTSSD